jgi:hypothetical protein
MVGLDGTVSAELTVADCVRKTTPWALFKRRGNLMTRIGYLGRGLVLATAALVGSATTASAAPLLINLEGSPDTTIGADVLFTYTATSSGTGRIDLAVQNTSTAYSPILTGLAFNLPGIFLPTVTGFTSSISGWGYDLDRNDVRSPDGFGRFDLGVLSGGSFQGGDPQEGIARGGSALFSIHLAGFGMDSLTENSFLGLYSSNTSNPQYFGARFQGTGANRQGSDVATPTGPPTPPTQSVPEPTTLLLSGLGLLGLTAMRRKA